MMLTLKLNIKEVQFVWKNALLDKLIEKKVKSSRGVV